VLNDDAGRPTVNAVTSMVHEAFRLSTVLNT